MSPIILSFNFSGLSKTTSFISFQEKLQCYIDIFSEAYNIAKQRYPQKTLVFIAHEHAITPVNNPHSNILDYTEHLMIQNALKEFTQSHSDTLVIFPYAFSKEYEKEAKNFKLKKIAKHFKNAANESIEKKHFNAYNIYSSEKITVVRNVCYLFREGNTVAKVDKKIPAFEYTLPNSSTVQPPFIQGSTFFQPGINRNNLFLDSQYSLTIELCADHAVGLLKLLQGSRRVDYHLIVANSTLLKKEHLVGRFNILCDAITGTSLVHLDEIDRQNIPLVISITPELQGKSYTLCYNLVESEMLKQEDLVPHNSVQ